MDELSLLNVVMRITHLSYGSFKLSLLIKTAFFYNTLKFFRVWLDYSTRD